MTAGHYPASRALAPTLCPPVGVRSRWITRASRELVSIARTRVIGADRHPSIGDEPGKQAFKSAIVHNVVSTLYKAPGSRKPPRPKNI
ncbi:MAG: hypothetical protein ACFFB3_13400 [Candidatus Hodarchaeota archaeon]